MVERSGPAAVARRAECPLFAARPATDTSHLLQTKGIDIHDKLQIQELFGGRTEILLMSN